MEMLVRLAGLVLATIFALAAAAALDWLFLIGMFRLMRPATARRSRVHRSELVHATRHLSHHFAAAPKL